MYVEGPGVRGGYWRTWRVLVHVVGTGARGGSWCTWNNYLSRVGLVFDDWCLLLLLEKEVVVSDSGRDGRHGRTTSDILY